MGEVASLIIRFAADMSDLKAEVGHIDETLNGMKHSLVELGTELAGAFTVEKIVEFVHGLMEAAHELENMSRMTGLSIDTLQEMQGVADQTGTSLDAFTNAMNRMQINIENGSEKTKKALIDLGLSQQQLLEMSPDEMWKTVAEALHEVTDKAQMAADAQALMGRGARELLPALTEGYDKLAEHVTKSGEAQVKALAAAEAALSHLANEAKNVAMGGLGSLVIAAEQFGQLDWKQKFGAMFLGMTDGFGVVNALASKGIAEVGEHAVETEQHVQKAATDAVNSVGTVVEGVKASQVEGLKELIALTDQFLGQDVINKATLFADAYDLLGGGIIKVRDAQKKANDEWAHGIEVLRQLGEVGSDTYNRFLTNQVKSSGLMPGSGEGGTLAAGALDVSKMMKATPADITGLSQSPDVAEARQRASEVVEDWQLINQAANDAADANDKAWTAYVNQLHSTADEQNKTMGSMTDAVRGFSRASQDALKAAVPKDFDWTAAYEKAGIFVNTADLSGAQAAMWMSGQTRLQQGHSIPGFATGTNGYQDFGSGTLAMLHGKEKVTPWGADSGGAVVVNVNGVLLSNNPAAKEELRRMIDDTVTTGIKRSRKFSY